MSQSALRPGSRVVMFNAIRVFAAMAVIWDHTARHSPVTHEFDDIGRFGVPLFTLASVFFIYRSLRKGPGPSVLEYAKKRANRVYMPLIAWSILYLGLRSIVALVRHKPLPVPDAWTFVWGGHSHLWYLPFVFVASVAVYGVARATVGNSRREKGLALLSALLGLGTLSLPYPEFLETSLGEGSYQCVLAWNAVPAIFFGITFSVAYQYGAERVLSRKSFLAACVTVLLATMVILKMTDGHKVAQHVGGLAVLCLGLAPWDNALVRRLGEWGQYSFGVYLCHYMFVYILRMVLVALPMAPSWTMDIAAFAMAVVGSFALAIGWGRVSSASFAKALTARIPATRSLLPPPPTPQTA